MIKNISIDLLIPFENHPFKKRSGIEQQELTQSIKENRLLKPIIVRPFPDGKYEIISGHRRVEACKALGITSIPVTIKEPTKDEAIVQMVDSNIHREHILPSEKAFAKLLAQKIDKELLRERLPISISALGILMICLNILIPPAYLSITSPRTYKVSFV